jgi:nucleotide-binding universal stress UspA family protein
VDGGAALAPGGTPLAAPLSNGALMTTFKHILVPTDFSEVSDRAIAKAVDLARAFDARLTLLHVWSLPTIGYAEGLSWPIDDLQKAAKDALAECYARISKLYPQLDTLLLQGNEWRQILETVKKKDCDLVVMGTHGRRGLPHLLLGSVAEKVVRLCTVPVLTVGLPKSGDK